MEADQIQPQYQNYSDQQYYQSYQYNNWANQYAYQDLSTMQQNQQLHSMNQMQNPIMQYMPQNIYQYMPQMGAIMQPTTIGGIQIASFSEWQQKQQAQAQIALLPIAGFHSYEETAAREDQIAWTSDESVEPMTHKRPYEDLEVEPNEYKKMKLTPEVSPMSKFQKEHCCGHGTFGKVWAAKVIATGRQVALKQIKLSGNEGFPRTAIREIIIMKKHVHPNILSIDEVVWSQGDAKDDFDVYLVMDFYNYDLRRLLEKFQLKFNSSEVKYLFRQLAEGVAYLHENILMHRDLKTENILINTTGHLKICDFGLARTFNPEGRMKTYTPVVITLWYRPPELLLGPCAYSCEVDQWSVGCIFAELLRSAVLFAGNSEIDQVDKIFSIMGSPSDSTWPEYIDLPGAQKTSFRNYSNRMRTIITPDILSSAGYDLLTKLLTYRPEDRINAAETLLHPYFSESPEPVHVIGIDAKLILASKST
jgi:hypothetical protein